MNHQSRRLSRRQFVLGAGASVAGLTLLAGCGRLPWQAQAPTKVPRVGLLFGHATPSYLDAFLQGLRERGYLQGQNIMLEYRSAEGADDRLPELAADLVGLPVDLIVTQNQPAAVAARTTTNTIPIVMANSGDPVATGLVASLSRPGGNVTGLSSMAVQLAGKRLELLKEAVPGIRQVGAIWDMNDAVMVEEYGATLVAAHTLGLELQSLGVRTLEDLDRAYDAAGSGQIDAVVVIGAALIVSNRPRLVDLSIRSRLPTISGDWGFAGAGGLMSYGPNYPQQFRRAAYYVDRILKGTKPADLPIEQPMTFDFVVNMKTARELGITFPQEILLQVTEVVQ